MVWAPDERICTVSYFLLLIKNHKNNMIIVSIACHPGITKLYYLAVRSWVVDDNSFPKFHVINIKPQK